MSQCDLCKIPDDDSYEHLRIAVLRKGSAASYIVECILDGVGAATWMYTMYTQYDAHVTDLAEARQEARKHAV